MSNRCCFFHAVSTLYHYGSIDTLNHILSETEDLVAQIQYQRQLEAPFWYVLVRDGGTVVHICRNLAGYFGATPVAMAGRCLWLFAKKAHRDSVQALFSRCAETGEAASDVFPGRYGAQLGVTVCRVPWCEDELGDLVALVWPLKKEPAWARFAFQSFDGLRPMVLLDAAGYIQTMEPNIAARLGGTPGSLAGRCLYDLFPPEKATRRRRLFQEAVWTGRSVEWVEVGETGIEYDMFKLPLLDRAGGQVDRVLLLGREREWTFSHPRTYSYTLDLAQTIE